MQCTQLSSSSAYGIEMNILTLFRKDRPKENCDESAKITTCYLSGSCKHIAKIACILLFLHITYDLYWQDLGVVPTSSHG